MIILTDIMAFENICMIAMSMTVTMLFTHACNVREGSFAPNQENKNLLDQQGK